MKSTLQENKSNLNKPDLRIIAGPDSIDAYNFEEIYQISEIKAKGKPAIYGTRTVGLKSRTGFDSINSDMGFMGCDFEMIMKNFNIFGLGGTIDDLKPLPSIDMASKIYRDTQMLCATEIMLPAIQLGCIAKEFKFKPFMVWNPSVDQLGWHVRQMAGFASEYDWTIGLKNGKWLGEEYDVSESENFQGITSIEKTWEGLISYASLAPETVLIQRGCDLPNKGQYRNLPIHQVAKRTKLRNNNIKLYYDPSHALGPKMQKDIVANTVEAMKMTTHKGWLYDGILIEVGTAKCDTHQHISVKELQGMVGQLAEFRNLDSGLRE